MKSVKNAIQNQTERVEEKKEHLGKKKEDIQQDDRLKIHHCNNHIKCK